MDDTKVNILDYTSLQRLNEALDYFGDSSLKLLESVSKYFENCHSEFEEQKKAIEEQLNEAKEELIKAEEDLNSARNSYNTCKSLQLMDSGSDRNAGGTDCKSEETDVDKADQQVQECENKVKIKESNLQIAESIIYNYNLEIEKYKWDSSSSGQNGKTSSSGCGGEKTLEIVANNHTQLARKKLDKMIEISEKYLGISHNTSMAVNNISSNEEIDLTLASREIKNEQKYESRRENVADANVSFGCLGCGLPVPICTCSRSNLT